MLDARKCIEIYDYCQKQWEKLAKKDGHYNPYKHDKVVFGLAAKEFKMSEAAIERAFDLVVKTSTRFDAKGNIKENIEGLLRKTLYNNVGLQIK